MPDSVERARAGAKARLENVVRAWTRSFDGRWSDLGDWERDAERTSLRKIMAGLKALELLPKGDPDRPPDDFPKLVEEWIERESVAHRHAGTDTSFNRRRANEGDYDFTMVQILELIHHFERKPELLSNDAIWALLSNERVLIGMGRGSRYLRRIPEVGNLPHHMMFKVFVHFPETENHVLMVNAWAYLVNRWLERNPRGDPRIRRHFAANPRSFQNEGSALERVLLSALARPLHSGFFETNARPYGAYTLRALELLYSYADERTPSGRRVRVAAQNALDFFLTQFAFQSFQGKRLAPSRRNQSYRNLLGVYQGDYVPFAFGVLTGAHVYTDDPDCRGYHCAYDSPQVRGFALESALSAYRAPELLWDLLLHPDNHQPGHGTWVRMQPRFSERHYLQSKWPRYPGNLPDLAHLIQNGSLAIEPAPELYFITADYMNSAGGRAEHYGGMDSWLPQKLKNANDLTSRPSTLLYKGDIGYWGDLGQLGASTLAFVGNFQNPSESNNTGVFKNFVYGYAPSSRPWPMTVPAAWVARAGRTIGALELELFDFSRNNAERNPELGFYVVLGKFARTPGLESTTGFWEVLPASAFAGADAAFAAVLEQNARVRFEVGKPYDYTLCLSGDRLRLNPAFGRNNNAFLLVNGTKENVGRDHVDFDQRPLRDMPLVEARAVDERYRETGIRYAYARGDGRLTIENPHLGRRLVLDSSNPFSPRRQEVALSPVSRAEAGLRRSPSSSAAVQRRTTSR
jgi:hypothetical protein